MSSLAFTKVAFTCPLVGLVLSYWMSAVGASLSIQFTVTGIVLTLPASSARVNTTVLFSVNVYVLG